MFLFIRDNDIILNDYHSIDKSNAIDKQVDWRLESIIVKKNLLLPLFWHITISPPLISTVVVHIIYSIN